MSIELARRLGRQAGMTKRAELTPTNPAVGLQPQAAGSLPAVHQPTPAPTAPPVKVQPQQAGGFGGLWSAFQNHMQDPAIMGAVLGNPATAGITKGILGATGAAGLFGMGDLLRHGGENIQTLLKGPGTSPPPA